MAHTYSHLYNLPTTGLRFFTVYGPWGRPDMALFLFADAMIKGEPIDVFNNGKMIRDFTFIDDIVEGVIRVLDKPATPDVRFAPLRTNPATSTAPYRLFNLGNGNPTPLADLLAPWSRPSVSQRRRIFYRCNRVMCRQHRQIQVNFTNGLAFNRIRLLWLVFKNLLNGI